jgi:hypothetical protein
MLQDHLHDYVLKQDSQATLSCGRSRIATASVVMLNAAWCPIQRDQPGVSARVVKGGAYGFASATGYGDDIDRSPDRSGSQRQRRFPRPTCSTRMPDFAPVQPFFTHRRT